MSHEIEIVNGKKRMVFNGAKPWHFNDGEGTCADVTGKQLSPMQMLEISDNNWTVSKVPAFAKINQLVNNKAQIAEILKKNEEAAVKNAKRSKSKLIKPIPIPELKEEWKINNVQMASQALVRSSDGKILDEVTEDWNPVQNQEAMEFFNEFIAAGDMEMETVGSLKGGQIIWGLAKIKDSFELFKGDRTDSYLLFSNFHKYGHSTTVMLTPIRVVCNNTLTMALGSKVDEMFKFSHRSKFDPEVAKLVLGVSKKKLAEYKDKAAFLGSKKAKNEDIVEYLKRLMPSALTDTKGKKPEDTLARNARKAYDYIDVQPGHQYAAGSWWQPFNAVTYFLDHEISRTGEQRLKQAWYGTHRTMKLKALDLATEFANAS